VGVKSKLPRVVMTLQILAFPGKLTFFNTTHK
jgi:hypothetical protein